MGLTSSVNGVPSVLGSEEFHNAMNEIDLEGQRDDDLEARSTDNNRQAAARAAKRDAVHQINLGAPRHTERSTVADNLTSCVSTGNALRRTFGSVVDLEGQSQTQAVASKDPHEAAKISGLDDTRFNGGFAERVIDFGSEEMFSKVTGAAWSLNLAAMQRINIHAIQRDLVRAAHEIRSVRVKNTEYDSTGFGGEPDWAELKALMRDYCRFSFRFPIGTSFDLVLSLTHRKSGQAWRDWGLMEEYAKKEIMEDPFNLLTVNPLSKRLMEEGKLLPPDTVHFSKCEHTKLLPGYPRRSTVKDKKLSRVIQLFCWSAAGGLSLIAPVLLMRLHNTLLTQLLTTGISVMLFALIIAAATGGAIPHVEAVDVGPQDVLAATAAYAAVLVVFISQGQ
jgi:hypothetical protein